MKIQFAFLLLVISTLTFTGCDNDDTSGGLGGDPGSLKVTLEWSQPGSDIDLDFEDLPNAAIVGAIYSGDVLEGPGQETYSWNENAPDGVYEVLIEYFEGVGEVEYTLNVQSSESGREFNGSVSEVQDEDFITFTKTGTRLSF